MKWIAADPNWGSIEKVQGECRTSRKGTHWTQVTESSTKEGCTFVLRSILNFNTIFECKKALKFITEVENSKYREAKDSCVKEESADGVLMWNNAALARYWYYHCRCWSFLVAFCFTFHCDGLKNNEGLRRVWGKRRSEQKSSLSSEVECKCEQMTS